MPISAFGRGTLPTHQYQNFMRLYTGISPVRDTIADCRTGPTGVSPVRCFPTGPTGILPVGSIPHWDNGHLARCGWQKALRLQRARRPLSQFPAPRANNADGGCPRRFTRTRAGSTRAGSVLVGLAARVYNDIETRKNANPDLPAKPIAVALVSAREWPCRFWPNGGIRTAQGFPAKCKARPAGP